MAGHVFISYQRAADLAYVERLAAFLAGAGVPVWYDSEIVSGERWHQMIETRLEECAALLVVMSPESKQSSWVNREITYAEQLGRPVFPLLLRGSHFFRLTDVQYEDVRDAGMPSSRFVARLRALGGDRGRAAVAGPVIPVYLILDVSWSTQPIIPQVNDMLSALVATIAESPTLANATYFSVITFSDNASVELPLVRMSDIASPPRVAARGGTQYGPALKVLKECIERDVASLASDGQRVHRPIAFFVTDGEPADESWERQRRELADGFSLHPTIVAVGIGSVDFRAIVRVASAPGLAYVSRAGFSPESAMSAFFVLLLNFVAGTAASVLNVTSGRGVPRPATFAPPDELVQVPSDFI